MHSHSAWAVGKGLSESIGRKVLRVRVPPPFTDELHGVATRQPLLILFAPKSEPLAEGYHHSKMALLRDMQFKQVGRSVWVIWFQRVRLS